MPAALNCVLRILFPILYCLLQPGFTQLLTDGNPNCHLSPQAVATFGHLASVPGLMGYGLSRDASVYRLRGHRIGKDRLRETI